MFGKDAIVGAFAAMFLLACHERDGAISVETGQAMQQEETGENGTEMLPGVVRVSGGVRGLPYAPPQRVFSSLEEYLEFRREAATMDAPILEQVGPDRFRETAGRLMSLTVREYTRNELLQMYGFE